MNLSPLEKLYGRATISDVKGELRSEIGAQVRAEFLERMEKAQVVSAPDQPTQPALHGSAAVR